MIVPERYPATRCPSRWARGAKAAARGGEIDPQVLAVMERMKPELVSPVAADLSHERCELNREVLIAGGGQVMRLCPTVTTGIARETLSIEDIAGNLAAIMDTEGARVAPVGSFLT